MSQSQREPQVVPADHAYTILQDHGPNDGGWGQAAVSILGMSPRPFVYTGSDGQTIETVKALVDALATETGKPTRLVRYTQREDLYEAGT